MQSENNSKKIITQYFHFHYNQIPTALNKLKIMSYNSCKYWIEETAPFNVLAEQLKTMDCGSRFLSNIVRNNKYHTKEKRFLSLLILTRRENESRGMH